jgi:A/G-specific adenine glycosylase
VAGVEGPEAGCPPSRAELNALLLQWYAPRRRAYPWRLDEADAYLVLVSEVMLQQTQAARVVPAFRSFVARFPGVRELAAAPRSDVIRVWAGLGYNRRAVGLSAAARAIVSEHGGRVPGEPRLLRALPGVGPYTAAAVASIAFGVPIPAIDTNVRRVAARVIHGVEATEIASARLAASAAKWIDVARPGAWNQALMDLGRAVCRPRPRCGECPLRAGCRFALHARTPAVDRQSRAPFEGSDRQVRGAVVRALARSEAEMTLRRLSAETGHPVERIAAAVRTLSRDGVVAAGAAALGGDAAGRVRLHGG